jgi:hypothetical protein
MHDASLYSDGLPPADAAPCGGQDLGAHAAAGAGAGAGAAREELALAGAAFELLRDPGAWLVGATLAAVSGAHAGAASLLGSDSD